MQLAGTAVAAKSLVFLNEEESMQQDVALGS